MERISSGAGGHQDPLVALLGSSEGSPGLDSVQLPRTHNRYQDLFHRLKANTELNEFTQCWEWVGKKTSKGYPRVTVRIDGRPVPLYAHRLMLELAHGFYFPYDEAGHLCDNPCCINPQHLEIQTPAFNLSERRGYTPLKGGERWIPVLFPIDGWQPHPKIVQLLAPVTEDCPF